MLHAAILTLALAFDGRMIITYDRRLHVVARTPWKRKVKHTPAAGLYCSYSNGTVLFYPHHFLGATCPLILPEASPK